MVYLDAWVSEQKQQVRIEVWSDIKIRAYNRTWHAFASNKDMFVITSLQKENTVNSLAFPYIQHTLILLLI
jgi:hypothetical protein